MIDSSTRALPATRPRRLPEFRADRRSLYGLLTSCDVGPTCPCHAPWWQRLATVEFLLGDSPR